MRRAETARSRSRCGRETGQRHAHHVGVNGRDCAGTHSPELVNGILVCCCWPRVQTSELIHNCPRRATGGRFTGECSVHPARIPSTMSGCTLAAVRSSSTNEDSCVTLVPRDSSGWKSFWVDPEFQTNPIQPVLTSASCLIGRTPCAACASASGKGSRETGG